MEEDEGGLLAAGGNCEGGVSWEDCGGGGLVSLPTVWDGRDTGGGETLPANGGGEEVSDFTEGNVAAVVEATDSGGARILLELGAASVDWAVPGSCSIQVVSNVFPFCKIACFISLKASCRVADGAERERPNDAEGAIKE